MNDEPGKQPDRGTNHEAPSAPRAGDPSSPFREITNLVKQYFNICNAALTHGADGALTAPAREVLTRLVSDETIAIEVSGTGAAEPPRYTTRFIDGQFTPIRGGIHDAQAHFVLSQEFLEDVEQNASTYIAHPEKLDWGWLLGGGGQGSGPTR